MTETVWLFNKSWTGVNIRHISKMNTSQQGIVTNRIVFHRKSGEIAMNP